MSPVSLNDDDIDISELADLVGNFLAKASPDARDCRNTPLAPDARRAVERYQDQKQLQAQIQDPLFEMAC
jgi:hypothetical protein